jgi:hypothetical protein
MKLIDIRKIERSELPNDDFRGLFDQLKEDTENFNTDLLELYEEEIGEFLKVVKKFKPEAIKTRAVRKAPVKKPKQPEIDFEADDVVEQVMNDYDLTKDKAIRLIALRKEAIELKKENLEKLLDRLEDSEFYKGRLSKSAIDKGRSRDLGKDSKQGSITLAEEKKMTGRPFKRISKKGAKNQYGTSEGGKVYYEYRMNRRDVDNKIKLKTGGIIMTPTANVYIKTTADFSEETKKRAGKYIILAWNTGQLKGMSFSPNEKWNTILVPTDKLQDFGWKRIDWSEVPKEALMTFHDELPFNEQKSFFPYSEPLPERIIRFRADGTAYKHGGGVGIPNADKMFHLPYEIAVYVPSTKDVDKSITASELRARVKEVEKYLAETFGGFTSSEKVGGYLSSKSSVITEKVVPVTAFCSLEDFSKNKAKLVNKMSIWAKMWGQEAIGFEFEGDLYYVPQKFKTGGKVKATYIPKSDIKMLTTVWGNNIKGKDLLDGAYTKRKNLKQAPKMSRTMFEEETFEFKDGGKTPPKPKMVRYFFEEEEQEYGKGGATEHGLKRGDTIVDDMFWENKIVVKDKNGKMALINLETGLRKEQK